MKSILKSLLINIISFWIVVQWVNGFSFGKGNETLFLSALVLGLINLFIKPLINILMLPINLITLGTFRWVVNVAALFLVTLIIPDLKIIGFNFTGLNLGSIYLPAYSTGGFLAIVLNSLLLSLISSFFYWLIK